MKDRSIILGFQSNMCSLFLLPLMRFWIAKINSERDYNVTSVRIRHTTFFGTKLLLEAGVR